jgi:DNA-binding NarL/FixJ family response regulator
LSRSNQGDYFLRILLADEGEMTRFALTALLEQQPGWIVVGEIDAAKKLLPKVEETNPDVVLLSWNLPKLRHEELISELASNFPGIAVIVLSGRPEMRPQAIAAGASAFVSKAEPPDRLLEAVKAINIMSRE